MSWNKKLLADVLFGVQIIGALVLSGSQFFRLLETTQGQLLSMFLIMEGFLCLNLMLAIGSHRAQPSRITKQTVWTYIMWLVLIGSNILAIFLNGHYQWSPNDTRTSLLAIGGAVVVFTVTKIQGVGLKDPMSKSLLAMIFKAMPQFVMTFEIAQKGGAGVPAAALIAGHITVLTRIGQIWLAIREAGWDRNRVWLGASEAANEISWIAVTAAWIFSQ
ncbi:MAG: hypothetical protein AAB673_02940 [Patescibacteria group bacterium]